MHRNICYPPPWPKDITILVAALNEEKNIEAAIDGVVAALDGVVDDYEIIVFDDGSNDRTGDLAEARLRSTQDQGRPQWINAGSDIYFARHKNGDEDLY